MPAPELAEIEGADLVAWTDGDGPGAAIARVLDGIGRLLVGDALPHAFAAAIRAARPAVELALDPGILAARRERKRPDELELLRAAGRHADAAAAWIAEQPVAGRSERDLALVVQTLLGHAAGVDELAAVTDRAPAAPRPPTAPTVGRRPGSNQTSAAQSRSSVLNRREPSCARAACVSDGANSRSDPGQRRSISAAHARCSAPVASIPITGPPAPLASMSRASSSTPSRSTGNETGSPIKPRSPLVNQTRLLTLPGSIATTSRSPGISLSSSSGDISPSR